jgi:hypothetical protein
LTIEQDVLEMLGDSSSWRKKRWTSSALTPLQMPPERAAPFDSTAEITANEAGGARRGQGAGNGG